MDNITPLPPDESLYAFMDGELDEANEQHLFDALASDKGLRGEMKDVLSIRNAVHRDIQMPPPDVERRMLGAVGFSGGTGAAVGASTSYVRNALYTMGGVILGAAVMWFLLRPSEAGYPTTASGPTQNTPAVAAAAPAAAPAPLIIHDTIVIKKVITRPAAPQPVIALGTESTINTDVPAREDVMPATTTAAPSMMSTLQKGPSVERGMVAQLSMPAKAYSDVVSLRIRALPSGVSDATTPSPTMDGYMLPNAAFGLTFPLGDDHRVGVEMAQETWHQDFDGTLDGRPIWYAQTPMLFWAGANYQYRMPSLWFSDDVRPYAETTLGMAFEQGPLGRVGLGLQYQPVRAVTMSLGVDAAALMYQFQNSWFTSSKWGVTYAISFNIGTYK